MKNKLHTIIKKCNKNPWCGYLQPEEILILINSNMISIDKWNQIYVDNAKINKVKGICNPKWFYFRPNEKFIELYRGLKKHY